MGIYLYVGIGVAVFLLLLFLVSYVKTSPQIAFVISGLSKKPKVLIGTGGFRIPFLQQLDKIYTGQITGRIENSDLSQWFYNG